IGRVNDFSRALYNAGLADWRKRGLAPHRDGADCFSPGTGAGGLTCATRRVSAGRFRPARAQGAQMRDPGDTYMNYIVPMVVEQTVRGERSYDIYSRLLK